MRPNVQSAEKLVKKDLGYGLEVYPVASADEVGDTVVVLRLRLLRTL
jgi:hypothetical protein